MRSRLGLALLFLLLFALAALVQWPAAWLAPRVEILSHQRWRLAAPQGTIWRGEGMLMTLSPTQGDWRNVQGLRWQLLATDLWKGALKINLQTEQGEAHFTLTARGLRVENFDLTLPADELIGQLSGALGRYGWRGQLHVQGKHFACDWSRHDCQGQAELRWKEATAREITGPSLGNYHLRIVGEGPALRINLSTTEGRLKLTGQGELSDAGKLNLSIEAQVHSQAEGPAQDESLERLLASLGRLRGEGKYRLEYRDYAH